MGARKTNQCILTLELNIIILHFYKILNIIVLNFCLQIVQNQLKNTMYAKYNKLHKLYIYAISRKSKSLSTVINYKLTIIKTKLKKNIFLLLTLQSTNQLLDTIS